LSVTEASPAARRLYEAAGFRVWGQDSRSLCWNGRYVDEYHLVLHLSDPSKTG
jgi:RimJ/RimL family protein N-acetyltransferase